MTASSWRRIHALTRASTTSAPIAKCTCSVRRANASSSCSPPAASPPRKQWSTPSSATSKIRPPRSALVSRDSTMRSNISVGPPLEIAFYRRDQLILQQHLVLHNNSPLIRRVQRRWNDGLRRAFDDLPRFDWESKGE